MAVPVTRVRAADSLPDPDSVGEGAGAGEGVAGACARTPTPGSRPRQRHKSPAIRENKSLHNIYNLRSGVLICEYTRIPFEKLQRCGVTTNSIEY